MSIEQVYEQNNVIVKDDEGVVGLTEDQAALRRWIVSDKKKPVDL